MTLMREAPERAERVETDDEGVTITIAGHDVLVKVNPDGDLVAICGERGAWLAHGVRPPCDD